MRDKKDAKNFQDLQMSLQLIQHPSMIFRHNEFFSVHNMPWYVNIVNYLATNEIPSY